VDINLAASNPWMASTLQFVAGLGPRKARALVQVRAPGLLPCSASPSMGPVSEADTRPAACCHLCCGPAQLLLHDTLSASAGLCADAH
jgi:hypothetical protein